MDVIPGGIGLRFSAELVKNPVTLNKAIKQLTQVDSTASLSEQDL